MFLYIAPGQRQPPPGVIFLNTNQVYFYKLRLYEYYNNMSNINLFSPWLIAVKSFIKSIRDKFDLAEK